MFLFIPSFMTLLSNIERSSEKTMEIMKNLRSIQALEGNRQLEDLIGISLVPCFLKGEVKKTKELMTKVIKQKLFEKKNSRIPRKGKRSPHPSSRKLLFEAKRSCYRKPQPIISLVVEPSPNGSIYKNNSHT
ncbi:centromere protein R isoform X1 [Acomys russatus]|uniref:centromere protein R isoform X1 n=1 Tax=Acomys russatus TaxID=60746 RepID=UPI0021E20467|nr:centromere protein R isoform X1 [Acomys russatus]